jgi:hypothetical protein
MRPWPRYVPGRVLPAHAPGEAAPAPALGAREDDVPLPASPDDAAGDWRRHPAFLWGVDLYNHGYPWEAHEVWERLWLHAPRGSAVHLMLQALIQCAAAAVHGRAGRVRGQERLAQRALTRLAAVRARAGSRCLGVDVDGLARAMRAYAVTERVDDWPRLALAPEADASGGTSGAEAAADAFAGKIEP